MGTETETLEELQGRHRKEQRDLLSRITQKKKGATKKNRKGINSECEELERKLKERQEQEVAALDGESVPDVNDVPELDNDSSKSDEEACNTRIDTQANGHNGRDGVNVIADTLQNTTISEEEGQPRKRNRQKERLARRLAEQEAAVAEAKEEAANQPDQRAIERTLMLKEFKAKGLIEKSIPPDGHCLFSAVADQLSEAGIPLGADSNAELKEDQGYKVVRKTAARYIEDHPDDFVAWLDEPLNHYVQKIRDTAEWGGHVELLALARAYNVEICILQNGTTQNIEPGSDDGPEAKKIWLAYYRHGFGLGEHYNSLRRAS